MLSVMMLLYLSVSSSTALRGSSSSTSDKEIPRSKTLIMAEDYVGAFSQGDYDYLPEHDVAFCICAKCGCSSLYAWVYEQIFKKPWEYQDAPWVMATDSSRWHGKVKKISASQLTNVKKKFAIIRDPQERLISSWKSKVSCENEKWGTDAPDRNVFVPSLAELAGLSDKTCMDLEEFLQTLNTIHEQGKAPQLNPHFLPQQFGCFRDLAPGNWTMTAPISDPDLLQAFGGSLGVASKIFPHVHSSKTGELLISDRARDLLKNVTKSEYEALQLPMGF